MSKKTSYLLGILLTIVIGTLLYCYLCDNCNCSGVLNAESTDKDNIVGDAPTTIDATKAGDNAKATSGNDSTTADAKTATYNSFIIKDDNGALNINTSDNFNFKASNFSVSVPVSASVDEGIAKLKDYLMANPGKSLSITANYTSGEVNNSALPNLGLARANSMKNYLVLKGIPSKYMDTYGELKNDLVADADGVYHGPVSFQIGSSGSVDTSKADMKALGDKIRANPLVLYFNSGQASINLTAEQRQKIADISKYLDKVEGSVCSVVGHTDGTGRRATNIRLGQERADFAKKYLVDNGIPESKLNTSSKGPDEPIATNATANGRAKNRRTVVTIN